jgi:microcystin degradation protein MlrC
MRIFVAGVATEVNTFSPIFMDIDSFKGTLYCRPGEHGDKPSIVTSPLIHARRRAQEEGFELVEGTICWATPGGMVNRQTFETIRDEILGQLADALPIDGVILCLHGAMVAVGYDDPEGDIVDRIRKMVGSDVPIAAGLDPHSHLTAKRVSNSNILVAFKEFPHTDFVERGAEVVNLLLRTVRREIQPVMSVFDCRMIDVFPTSWQPMRGFVDRMFELERSDEKVLSLSLIHGFYAGDVPEFGTRMLVITNNDRAHGDELAKKLGMEVFSLRGQSMPKFLTPDQAIDKALASPGRPVVIADFWDNPGGGVAGDATVILRNLIDRKVENAALAMIWDPMAVKFCLVAGVGARVPLRFGAKCAPGCGDPIDATVLVKRIVRNAQQTFGASLVSLGDCAVVEVAGVEVILTNSRTQALERTVFSAVGIDPLSKSILVVKSSNHFYADFCKIASEVIYCQAGRPYPMDPKTNDYRKVRRTIWPIIENPFSV